MKNTQGFCFFQHVISDGNFITRMCTRCLEELPKTHEHFQALIALLTLTKSPQDFFKTRGKEKIIFGASASKRKYKHGEKTLLIVFRKDRFEGMDKSKQKKH